MSIKGKKNIFKKLNGNSTTTKGLVSAWNYKHVSGVLSEVKFNLHKLLEKHFFSLLNKNMCTGKVFIPKERTRNTKSYPK
jgi:hypothetical protein